MIQESLNRSRLKDDVYLFRADQDVLYQFGDDTARVGPQAVEVGWPGLKGSQFAEGIDAALP
ncbi:hypothetical protein [Streptomyces sp. NPDC046939]|uniref:hypothetical protein n=1 Tax=Streptomyces sp. NPDC046939 TaxID=3155376 RepID=UPI0033DF5EB1